MVSGEGALWPPLLLLQPGQELVWMKRDTKAQARLESGRPPRASAQNPAHTRRLGWMGGHPLVFWCLNQASGLRGDGAVFDKG